MSMEVSLEVAKKNLEDVLAKLSPGEGATLISQVGEPIALLVSLKPSREMNDQDWQSEWESLSIEIERAWKSDKSGLEILSEMRR